MESYIDRILEAVVRVETLTQATPEITNRGYLLLFRILLAQPDLAGRIVNSKELVDVICMGLDSSPDIAVKIVTVACSTSEFCRQVPVDKITDLAEEAA